jgi:hypothetical protein
MGRKTKDGAETLTMLYYSPQVDNIILLFKRDNSITITVDFEKTRMCVRDNEAFDYILRKNYHLIGAFYEN